MTGAFSIKGKEITKYKRSAVSDKEEWPSKFSKVFLKLDDGLEVSFTDKRRLARVRLLDDPIAAPPISELGPDAFLELPLETTFMRSILKKRCPIKALIMDQNFLAGIGNWVADEVLYQARIHPEQVASSLSETECMRLHKTIQEVLKLSVDVNADSEMFPKDWIFHYRWNKKPGEVGGEKISFITVGGRTSAIVPALQKCTLQSSRKKGNSIDGLVDENGTENVTTKTKRKSGRKEQTSKAAPPPDGEDLVVKNKKSSTKESLPVSKAEPKKGRGSIRAASKQIVEAEKESKLAVSRGKKTGKALKPRDQKEESPESRLELGKQQVKAPARKRSGKEEPTEVARTSRVGSAHNEKNAETTRPENCLNNCTARAGSLHPRGTMLIEGLTLKLRNDTRSSVHPWGEYSGRARQFLGLKRVDAHTRGAIAGKFRWITCLTRACSLQMVSACPLLSNRLAWS
ncbi:hypothetical protein GOP47_0020637 [Adiantum capillus-veneris]|uniref:Formamidopyrimidine-DNA glycosylase H2TH DNA-binding domain-containing protein n=1 Tax=Adiantum capillus-veneris TaxID=13818 RepID=A0A9D4Z7X4_ADICA|nr:hypothetical protein GOP47_0020637 [Adiantum capillus-veneris]